jgi:hypothetical protein
MKNSRRRFLEDRWRFRAGSWGQTRSRCLRFGGRAGAGYHMAKGEDALTAKQWAMVIDPQASNGRTWNPSSKPATRSTTFPRPSKTRTTRSSGSGKRTTTTPFPDRTNPFLNERWHQPFLVLCNHCEDPALRACLPHPGHFQARERRHRADGLSPLHRLPVLHGRLSLRCPELQLQGSAAFYRRKQQNSPPA